MEKAEYSFKYSNFGIAILGTSLEEMHDEDYTIWMNAYILEDFKLTIH